MKLNESMLAQVRAEWRSAPHGLKSAVIAGWAEALHYSYQSIYRRLRTGRKRKRSDAGRHKIAGIGAAAKVVFQIKISMPKAGAGKITTGQAVKLAIAAGLVPKEMESVSIATFNRVIREWASKKKSQAVKTSKGRN